MVADGALFARDDDGTYWIDAGTPAQYLAAMLDLIDGSRGEAPPAVADSASVDPGARLDGAVVMAGARVVAGANLERCAVLPGAVIGAGAFVADSVVGPACGRGRRSGGDGRIGARRRRRRTRRCKVVRLHPPARGAGVTAWLVTGGAGYIGSHVAHRLVEAGHDVVVLDDLSSGVRSFVPAAATFVEGSIGDAGLVRKLLGDAEVDGIVHLAALKYAGVSVAEPLRFYSVNVEGMRVLLEEAVAVGVEQFVYSSSCSVYGTPAVVPVVEATATRPESPYGETKLIGEWLLADVARVAPMRHTSLRYFNVVGSGYDDIDDRSPHNLFPLVFRAIDAGEPPKVFGTDYPTPDGSCIRDYIDVGDLADAHVVAAHRLEAGDELQPAYNIGTGVGASVLEVIEAVRRVLEIPLPVELNERRPGDPARIVADPSAARADLGWVARQDLDDMVRTAWAAWRRNH